MNTDEITKNHRSMIATNLTVLSINAREAANRFGAAYWADNHRDFLINEGVDQFHELADMLGYELTLKDEFKPQPTAMEAKAK